MSLASALRANVALLFSERSRREYATQAQRLGQTYRFTDARGRQRKWLKGGCSYRTWWVIPQGAVGGHPPGPPGRGPARAAADPGATVNHWRLKGVPGHLEPGIALQAPRAGFPGNHA